MNIRNVLTVYTKLRNFTDDESALLETLRTMNDSERELLVETLAPQKQASKKGSSKGSGERCSYVYGSGVTCGRAPATTVHINSQHIDYHEFRSSKSSTKGAKSRRASSLAGAMRDSIKAHIEDPTCRFRGQDGMYCGLPEVSPIHDKTFGYAGYHEFDAGKSSASTAERSSSANGGVGSVEEEIDQAVERARA